MCQPTPWDRKEPKAGFSGLAKKAPQHCSVPLPPQGKALLTTPVGKIRPSMEHVPMIHPREPGQQPHRPSKGSPGPFPPAPTVPAGLIPVG